MIEPLQPNPNGGVMCIHGFMEPYYPLNCRLGFKNKNKNNLLLFFGGVQIKAMGSHVNVK